VFRFLDPLSKIAASLGVAGLAGLAITGGAAQAQSPSSLGAIAPVAAVTTTAEPPCATGPGGASCPKPGVSPAMPTTPTPPTRPGEPSPVQPTPETPSLSPGETGAGGGEFGLSAPFMIGDLLYATRSINYGFNRITGNTSTFGLGSTSIVNAAVAENNSPVPYDRLYFRYNYFNNSQSITGTSNITTMPVPGSGVLIAEPQTKKYDTNLYTFGGEKTFLDGCASVEVRLPIVSTLAVNNDISVGSVAGFLPPGNVDTNGNRIFAVTPTPGQTLGHDQTYYDNMMVILKGVFYRNDDRTVWLSGGLGIGIPTAPDTRVRVVDYTGTAGIDASGQQTRVINIANSTWALSPFLAALVLPSERFFVQGFLQVECPLNSSEITYSDRFSIGTFGTGGPTQGALQAAIASGQSMAPPFTSHARIDEQYLLHADVGTGYWLVRNQGSDSWLTGVAFSLEGHYTGTLTPLQRVQLPGNGFLTQYDPNNPIPGIKSVANQIPDIGPVVGAGPRNVNIVDVTAGTTFVLGNRATIATAFTVPVTNGSNKTFDWEFHLQVNFLFGGPR
jgi:hypothetical protein